MTNIWKVKIHIHVSVNLKMNNRNKNIQQQQSRDGNTSRTQGAHPSANVFSTCHLSLLSQMQHKEKEIEEEKEEEVFCCHSSDLSRSFSFELSGSSAGARLAYPGSFWCVHIICIHFLPGNEASFSLKPCLTNSLPESCWSSLS